MNIDAPGAKSQLRKSPEGSCAPTLLDRKGMQGRGYEDLHSRRISSTVTWGGA